jgi:hypothetical protein
MQRMVLSRMTATGLRLSARRKIVTSTASCLPIMLTSSVKTNPAGTVRSPATKEQSHCGDLCCIGITQEMQDPPRVRVRGVASLSVLQSREV